MLTLSKLVAFLVIFFCFAMPLGAMHTKVNEITEMTLEQIKKVLENSSYASVIATHALSKLRHDDSVTHEKVDLLITYADKSDLIFVLSLGSSHGSTYVLEQMKKKAQATDDFYFCQ